MHAVIAIFDYCSAAITADSNCKRAFKNSFIKRRKLAWRTLLEASSDDASLRSTWNSPPMPIRILASAALIASAAAFAAPNIDAIKPKITEQEAYAMLRGVVVSACPGADIPSGFIDGASDHGRGMGYITDFAEDIAALPADTDIERVHKLITDRFVTKLACGDYAIQVSDSAMNQD